MATEYWSDVLCKTFAETAKVMYVLAIFLRMENENFRIYLHIANYFRISVPSATKNKRFYTFVQAIIISITENVFFFRSPP